MKIELKIYLTKRQRFLLKQIGEMLIGLGYSLKEYILPFIEIVAAVIMAISMCCMDSPNFRLIFTTYCISAVILVGCHICRLYIEAELRRRRRARYRYHVA